MRSLDKEIIINPDVLMTFINLVHEIKENASEDIKELLEKILDVIQNNKTTVDNILSKIKDIEKNNLADTLMLGVLYFFIAKIYAKRKDFGLSISLLEKSEMYLSKSRKDLSVIIRKEISILRLAYHYNEN